jgi:hypothetical protein
METKIFIEETVKSLEHTITVLSIVTVFSIVVVIVMAIFCWFITKNFFRKK